MKYTKIASLANFSLHNEIDFKSPSAVDGLFTVDEARAAIQRSVNQNELAKGSNTSENSLKIMLGLALSHQDKDLYKEVSQCLSNRNQTSFQPLFDQLSRSVSDKKIVSSLLELSLKAALVCNNAQAVEVVLKYSEKWKYRLSIDEETLWWTVNQTMPDRPLDSDFTLLKLLLAHQIQYKCNGADQNSKPTHDQKEIDKENEKVETAKKQESKPFLPLIVNAKNNRSNSSIDDIHAYLNSKDDNSLNDQSRSQIAKEEDYDTTIGKIPRPEAEKRIDQKPPDEQLIQVRLKSSDQSIQSHKSQLDLKYLKPSDCIKMLISIEQNQAVDSQDGIQRLFIGLIKHMDYNVVSLVMLDCDLYETFGDLEVICSRRNLVQQRDAFITAMFIAALNRGKMSLAMHIITTYTSILLQSSGQVVKTLLMRLEKDNYEQLEAYLMIVQYLQPEFHFDHAEKFVSVIEGLKAAVLRPKGVMLKWSNPLMIMVLLADVLENIRLEFSSLNLRVVLVKGELVTLFTSICNNYGLPDRANVLLRQRGWYGTNTVLEYISALYLFDFLQLKHVNRVVGQMWQGKSDVGGSVFSMSTSYQLLFKNEIRFKEDRESQRLRFYRPRAISSNIKSHWVTLQMWQHSNSLRYNIEMVLFFALLCYFQTAAGDFNRNLKQDILQVQKYQALAAQIVEMGGVPLGQQAARLLTGSSSTVTAGKTVEELVAEQKSIHDDLVDSSMASEEALQQVVSVSLLLLLFPLSLLCKYVFTRLTQQSFTLTGAHIVDFTLICTLIAMYAVISTFSEEEVTDPLLKQLGQEQKMTTLYENILQRRIENTFHFDQLLAAFTSVLWVRMVLFFSLNEFFGPTLVMIYMMGKIIMKFTVLWILITVVFAAVATLTFTEMSEFATFWDSILTYSGDALGQFDWTIYNSVEPEWKRYLGLLMSIGFTLIGMLLLVNLLIAIMMDQYSQLSSVRQGLFWRSIINEMPKYEYHEHYGVLSMLPFVFSWLSLLFLPLLLWVKNKRVLAKVNQVCFVIAYLPVFLVCLAFFMISNLLLLPFAYLKTIVHKATLMRRYKSVNYCGSLLFFIVFGVPLLLVSQITDVFHFMVHSFYPNQRLQTMKREVDAVSLGAFEQLLAEVKQMINEEGMTEINARELIQHQADKLDLSRSFQQYLFRLEPLQNQVLQQAGRQPAQSLTKKQEKSLQNIKTYNLIKKVIWGSVLEDTANIPKAQQNVDLISLRDVMNELKVQIDFMKLHNSQEMHLHSKHGNKMRSDMDKPEVLTQRYQGLVDQLLLRFSVIEQARVNNIIMGLIKSSEKD